MEASLVVVVAIMAAVILALILMRTRERQGDSARLDERLDSLNQRIGEVTGQASTYHETLNAVNQTLGGLTQSSERIMEVGRDMQKLQEVLAAPTLRGGIGELMLEGVLQQMLPKGFYETQHTFRNGHRVDAVIRLAEGLVSVDAKFPIESFRRLMEAKDGEQKTRLNRFRSDIKRHIDDIAEKYICPGETLDFALMYIPAENVYYEIVLKADHEEDLLDYAWTKRVVATSPNSFYAYLQVIALGLRGLQVEQNAQDILRSLNRLRDDFDRFAGDYRVIGTHLGHAQSKYNEAFPKLESIRGALPGQHAGPSLGEPQETAGNSGPGQESQDDVGV